MILATPMSIVAIAAFAMLPLTPISNRHLGNISQLFPTSTGEWIWVAAVLAPIAYLIFKGNRTSSCDKMEFLGRRAQSHWAAKDYDKAIADYLEVVNVDPNDRQNYHWLTLAGDCAYSKGDLAKAIDCYSRAIAINSSNSHGYAWRGAAKCRLGQHEAALLDYDEAIRLRPHNASYYSGRGVAHSRAGNHDLAMKDHELAFKLAGL
jgi:tetratricopeptide (TPR) repeat protein